MLYGNQATLKMAYAQLAQTVGEELKNEAMAEERDRGRLNYRIARSHRRGRQKAPQHSAVDYMGRTFMGESTVNQQYD